MQNKDLEFFEKLNNHPTLKKRFEEIINIAENTSGELITADEAEGKAIEELRKLGQEVLTEWAHTQHEKSIENAKKEEPKATKRIKKNSTGNVSTDK